MSDDDYSLSVTEQLGNPEDEDDYKKRLREEHYRGQMVESIMGRRPNQPPPPYDNPLPHGRDKWQAKEGLQRLKLNGRDASILWALIDYANPGDGLCFPSERTVAALLARPVRTIERGIRSLAEKGLAMPEPTMGVNGVIYNRYRVNWAVLLAAFDAMQKTRNGRKKPKVTVTPPSKVTVTPPSKGTVTPPSKVTA